MSLAGIEPAPPGNWRRFANERWRGRIPIPDRAHPLVRRLVAEMNKRRVTVREIAARAGVDYQTISAWRYRAQPSLENLIACFNALGCDLVVIHRDEPA
jgi:hypothetical protein